MGDSRDVISGFPAEVKQDLGYQLHRVQNGDDPTHWKPMTTVGPGTREILAQDENGWFRVFYVCKLMDQVCVLHAFSKKTNQTSQADIESGRRQYSALVQEGRNARAAAKNLGKGSDR